MKLKAASSLGQSLPLWLICSGGPATLALVATQALAAIHHKLANPDAASTANNPAIAEVGEPGWG